MIRPIPAIAGLVLTSLLLSLFYDYDVMLQNSNTKYGKIDVGDPFPEPPYTSPRTMGRRIVVASEFARFEVHHVLRDDGSIAEDWLWSDERAHVNILVHLKADNKYMLFRQTKYGLNSFKYAPVGGLFNVGETPEECARRELLEETGLLTESLVNLGTYRVQADRGGGMLHTFVARNCYPVLDKNRLKSDDYEKQLPVTMSLDDLVKTIKSGEIGEAQWLGVVGLGVLYEQYKPKS